MDYFTITALKFCLYHLISLKPNYLKYGHDRLLKKSASFKSSITLRPTHLFNIISFLFPGNKSAYNTDFEN